MYYMYVIIVHNGLYVELWDHSIYKDTPELRTPL